ncbi:hypothetical protein N7494_000122 [Penicillium frequentans]|uniref:Uncharacterized protein n=1 Tax=Penicillium frequentans TaxID=3151616 RepID=A0AAD6D5B3_9EURO|nr:hypothetical protein N7494_000122 [Penicillium glabrum]
MSAFQRMRLQEKQDREAAAAAEAAALGFATPDSEDTPSISSANRTTLSSTASGPTANARFSTAATSIDESQSIASHLQPTGPPHTAPTPEFQMDARPHSGMSNPRTGSVRSRRLYGQGLTQNVQNQQNSTLHRLESLSRQRSGTPDLLPLNRNYSRSASNLRDRLQKLAIAEPSGPGPNSPPSSATSPKYQPYIEVPPKERISPTGSSFGAPPLSPLLAKPTIVIPCWLQH